MKIAFVSPTAPHPVGGVLSIFNLANALSRRGHEVDLFHLGLWGPPVSSMEEVSWFDFEPAVAHHFADGSDAEPPHFDVIFGTGVPSDMGLPVLLLQGVDMLHPWLERKAFRTPCLKICVASWLVDVGVRYGAPAEQFAVALCGLDPTQFAIDVPVEDRERRVAVLHHTHVAKGWNVALSAIEEAQGLSEGFTVSVFGTEAPTEPLPPWATFHHRPDHETLARDIYNRSQVFLQASHYEGLGLTAIEAMSSGCALVTTDCGGSRDYAIQDETAIVVPACDVAGLASGIVALLDDPGLRFRLALAGREHVQRFDWDLGAEVVEGHLARYIADPQAFQAEPGPEQPFSHVDHLPDIPGIPTAPSRSGS